MGPIRNLNSPGVPRKGNNMQMFGESSTVGGIGSIAECARKFGSLYFLSLPVLRGRMELGVAFFTIKPPPYPPPEYRERGIRSLRRRRLIFTIVSNAVQEARISPHRVPSFPR